MIIEIGVVRGVAARYMAEHVANHGCIDKIYAVDTLSSFVIEYANNEVLQRGKTSTKKTFDNLTPDGIALINDCKLDNQWCGTLQTNIEFASELNV